MLSNHNLIELSWEVFFGIAAACIPTLRPGYKLAVTKIHTHWTGGQSIKRTLLQIFTLQGKRSTGNRDKVLKPHAENIDEAPNGQDLLPLQDFGAGAKIHLSGFTGVSQTQNLSQGESEYARSDLHLPGDLSTHRPGYFKRLDSEAEIGGRRGVQETEARL